MHSAICFAPHPQLSSIAPTAALRVLADVTQQAHDDLVADGRGGGTTVDAKIQRRLASNAAINQRMAALKRKRAQQAGPVADGLEGDDQPSDDEEDDSDDEDAPLPGELESDDGEQLSTPSRTAQGSYRHKT